MNGVTVILTLSLLEGRCQYWVYENLYNITLWLYSVNKLVKLSGSVCLIAVATYNFSKLVWAHEPLSVLVTVCNEHKEYQKMVYLLRKVVCTSYQYWGLYAMQLLNYAMLRVVYTPFKQCHHSLLHSPISGRDHGRDEFFTMLDVLLHFSPSMFGSTFIGF